MNDVQLQQQNNVKSPIDSRIATREDGSR